MDRNCYVSTYKVVINGQSQTTFERKTEARGSLKREFSRFAQQWTVAFASLSVTPKQNRFVISILIKVPVVRYVSLFHTVVFIIIFRPKKAKIWLFKQSQNWPNVKIILNFVKNFVLNIGHKNVKISHCVLSAFYSQIMQIETKCKLRLLSNKGSNFNLF